MIEVEKIVENIRIVDSKRDYWFVRTFGGQLYSSFIEDGYVGLGFNSVPPITIRKAADGDASSFEQIKSNILNNTEYKKGEATKWAKQLVDFEKNVKKGDIVISPNAGSHKVSIGIVDSETYLVEKPGTFENIRNYGKIEEFPQKRKRVKWLKELNRGEFKGEIGSLIASQRGLTNANKIYDKIESQISSIFIREEKIYMSLNIDQEADINAFDLSQFLDGLTYFYREICIEQGLEEEKDLLIKIKLQSKGTTMLKALSTAGLIGLGGIVALSNNPELDIDLSKGKLNSKSDGFLKSVTEFLDAKEERRQKQILFNDSISRLRVIPPTDSILGENSQDNSQETKGK